MILLIEDEEILRFSFTTFLVEAGYQVTEADSLAMGRKMLRREEPELVLCDILFPDGNGIELLEQIHQQYPDCPVIMITGQSGYCW